MGLRISLTVQLPLEEKCTVTFSTLHSWRMCNIHIFLTNWAQLEDVQHSYLPDKLDP